MYVSRICSFRNLFCDTFVSQIRLVHFISRLWSGGINKLWTETFAATVHFFYKKKSENKNYHLHFICLVWSFLWYILTDSCLHSSSHAQPVSSLCASLYKPLRYNLHFMNACRLKEAQVKWDTHNRTIIYIVVFSLSVSAFFIIFFFIFFSLLLHQRSIFPTHSPYSLSLLVFTYHNRGRVSRHIPTQVQVMCSISNLNGHNVFRKAGQGNSTLTKNIKSRRTLIHINLLL